MKYIKWLNQINKDDISLVGGKGANLGEMVQAGFPVPNGFCITAKAYFTFIKTARIDDFIRQILKKLDSNDSSKLQKSAEKIQDKIRQSPFPRAIQIEIIQAYHELLKSQNQKVAVRSSATAEDLPEASFAGQQESYMNILGERMLLQAVQRTWASLFGARSIFYREEQGFDHLKVGIAGIVQLMVQSEVSGVMFTVDPMSSDLQKIAIEAGFGLGDAIVSGSITPDQYLVDKESLAILTKNVIRQERMLASSSSTLTGIRESRFQFTPVSHAYQEKQKLSDEKIIELAEIGREIEKHYQYPQDIEWAYEASKLYIVQTRPVTTLKVKSEKLKVKSKEQDGSRGLSEELQPLLTGLAASPGVASGLVKKIRSAKEIGKVKKGDVLVTEMTNPDFVPAMKKAVAIVTDLGGRTSHAAIVSRELGIVCVVGTEQATKMLKTGELVTVDGVNGKIYSGKVDLSIPSAPSQPSTLLPLLQTATKVYVNLGEPELAEKIAKRPVDGVGLLRAEFMISEIGEHPRAMLEKKKRALFVSKLAEGILTIARSFDPRPVIYRTTDFKTNEYRNLRGGAKYEEEETNPMLGFRGVMRYLKDAEVFKMELAAVKKVRRYHRNLWLMLPFVRTPGELSQAKKLMATEGLYTGASLKLFIMVEVPSTVVILEKFIGVGIDGISIGSNDLTQLTLGLDRDNPKVAHLFDERDEAILWMLERAITTSRQHGIMSSICGQAPSVYPELTEKLVEWGVTSISVSPDMIEKTREIVAEAERKKVLCQKRF